MSLSISFILSLFIAGTASCCIGVVLFYLAAEVKSMRKNPAESDHEYYFVIAITAGIYLFLCIIFFSAIEEHFYFINFKERVIGVFSGLFLLTYFLYIAYPIWSGKDLLKDDLQPIEKKVSIKNNEALFDVLHTSQAFGSPLVCFVHEDESHSYTDEQKNWNENFKKAYVSCEDRGLVVGAPGSGKTTFLIAQLISWMLTEKSFVATDIKPEIWAILKENGIFEKFGYTDWVFNPTDPQSHHYNIFSETQSAAELNEILAVIIPNNDASAEVFVENARRLLKAVILHLGSSASLPACQSYINNMDDINELLKTLKQSENETVAAIAKDIARTAKNENLLSSIMTSLSKAFVFLDDERIRATTADSAEGFQLKEILNRPKQAVFLQFDQQYKNTTAHLLGAMVAHTLRILQASSRYRDDVFVVLDEIINCAPIPKFLDSLNTMRSAKMPTFLYLQALEGLNRVYGPNADRLFMGACDFIAVFKIGDIETAKQISERIGKTETIYRSRSNSSSSGNSSSKSGSGLTVSSMQGKTNSLSDSSSDSVRMEYVIEPEEFLKLPAHDAVVMYKGCAAQLHMPVYYRDYPVPQRPSFVTIGEIKKQA